MPIRQQKQARNVRSVLGDVPVQLTVLGVWLTGIVIGAIMLLLIVLPNTFAANKVMLANQASADFTNVNQIDPATYTKLATEGKRIFTLKCQVCHAAGGTAATGQGPRLDRSNFARDAAMIITTVRQGVLGQAGEANPGKTQAGMPNFADLAEPTDAQPNVITGDELYKVTVYLRSVQQAPRGQKPVLPAAGA